MIPKTTRIKLLLGTLGPSLDSRRERVRRRRARPWRVARGVRHTRLKRRIMLNAELDTNTILDLPSPVAG